MFELKFENSSLNELYLQNPSFTSISNWVSRKNSVYNRIELNTKQQVFSVYFLNISGGLLTEENQI